jgi:hypothetical protein
MEERATVRGKSLDTPDETHLFVDKGKADIVHLGHVSVGRFVLEPGWSWSAGRRTLRVARVRGGRSLCRCRLTRMME